MTIERKTTHISEALAHRIEQFKNKPNFEYLLRSWLEQIQDSENTSLDILEKTWLSTATGAQLDELGKIVGEQRFDRNDSDYLDAIETRILLNLSEGTIEDILGLIESLSPGLTMVTTEYFPAGFVIASTSPIDPAVVDVYKIGDFIKSGRPAGVNGSATFFVASPFQFDTGLGYDDGKYGVAVGG